MNLPNKITLMRVCMIPVFMIALLGEIISEPYNRYIADIIFIIASLTDMLDGHIARSRNLITNFGKFMDPLADKLLVSAALIAMIELSLLPAWVVILIISREFIITGFRLIASDKNIVIAAGFYGKLKTITQMAMIIFILPDFNWKFSAEIGKALVFFSVLFTIVSAVEYIFKNKDALKD